MKESTFSNIITAGFPGAIVRVENPACPGTSDINYHVADTEISGWLELKVSNSKNKIKVDHLEQHQITWMFLWCINGGRADCLIKHGPKSYLVSGLKSKLLKKIAKEGVEPVELRRESMWSGSIPNGKVLSDLLKTVYYTK